MKSLSNQPILLTPPPGRPGSAPNRDSSVAAILRDVVNFSDAEQGLPFAEQRRRIRILDVLDAAEPGGQIILEDADYEALVRLLDKMCWGWVDRAFLEVERLVKGAGSVAVQAGAQ